MTRILILWLTLATAVRPGLGAPVAGGTSPALPFDREVINRYSLNGRPRSLAIRQGNDVWLGYDLEQAKPFKVWQAPPGKPGVLTTVFVSRSAGTTWFDDASKESWQLQRGGNVIPLVVRFLGCSQRAEHFELSWELKHAGGVLKLQERVARAPAPAAERVARELRVTSLAAGELLLVPRAAAKSWKLLVDGQPVAAALSSPAWHRFTLP